MEYVNDNVFDDFQKLVNKYGNKTQGSKTLRDNLVKTAIEWDIAKSRLTDLSHKIIETGVPDDEYIFALLEVSAIGLLLVSSYRNSGVDASYIQKTRETTGDISKAKSYEDIIKKLKELNGKE